MSLLTLPDDILLSLASYTHNIEDYTSLRQTCRRVYDILGLATPNTILRLAAAQSTTFFRPSPWFLVAATARELGHWARISAENEAELSNTLQHGIEALLDLSLTHCGLTLSRIRELHLMRFSIINPITDITDKCVGSQWYSTPSFWSGGVSDPYTISAEPGETLFQLAIYGELFGPDFSSYLNKDSTRRLTLETRLEFVKYCIPDFATQCQDSAEDVRMPDGSIDPRRFVKETGPYADGGKGLDNDNNIALVWLLKSSRWRPYWKEARALAGPEFEEGFFDDWGFLEEEDVQDWRQRMWEAVMVCQGLEGLGMMRPKLRDGWTDRIREWRAKIEEMEKPEWVRVGKQATLEYPFLFGDLRICGSGFVAGS
jgi:hypothetical protein